MNPGIESHLMNGFVHQRHGGQSVNLASQSWIGRDIGRHSITDPRVISVDVSFEDGFSDQRSVKFGS
jgi:hypothetical protein